jgi:hypothetical protein
MGWRTLLTVVACAAAAIYAGSLINNYDFRRLATEPPRPNGVPAEAVWDGGMKGGSFILCDVRITENVDHCTIYHASSGLIWSQGDFRLTPDDRAAQLNELSFAGYDGMVIHLTDGRVLTEVPSNRPKN